MSDFEESEYEQAVAVCRQIGRISGPAIQRSLRIGYVKTCLIIEAMGARGIAERVDPDGAWVFTETRHDARLTDAEHDAALASGDGPEARDRRDEDRWGREEEAERRRDR